MNSKTKKSPLTETFTLTWAGPKSTQARSLRLPGWLLLSGGLVSAGMLIWALGVTLATGRIGLMKAKEEESLHRAVSAVQTVESRMEEQAQTLERLRQMESRLAKVLSLGDKKSLVGGGSLDLSLGKGGPEQGLAGNKEADLARLEARIKGRLDEDFRRVEEASRLGEGVYARLNDELRQARSLAASTPRGFPAKGWITSGYGNRVSPIHGGPAFHRGVDIANQSGTPIRATAAGVVIFAGANGDYGRLVILRHGAGLESRYGHMRSFRVRPGARVERGDVIGYMGSTGASTGTHVHYEIWKNGRAVDPKTYMAEARS